MMKGETPDELANSIITGGAEYSGKSPIAGADWSVRHSGRSGRLLNVLTQTILEITVDESFNALHPSPFPCSPLSASCEEFSADLHKL
jgi:hypothetical protein